MALTSRFKLSNINQNVFLRLQEINRNHIDFLQKDIAERRHSILKPLQDPINTNHNDVVLLEFERYKLPFKAILNKNTGLVRTDPYVTTEYLNEFYEKHYRDLYKLENDAFFEVSINEAVKFGYKVFSYVKDHIKKESKILDYGCGLGMFSIPFVLNGYNNYKGVDLGEDYIAYGQKMGFNIFQSSIDDLINNDEKFDLIIMHHVLEHIPNINEFLEKVKLILNKDGLFYISVPGLINLPLGYDLIDFFQFPHCWSFTRSSLCTLMTKSGFAEIKGNENIDSLFKQSSEIPSSLNFYNESDLILRYLSRIEFSFKFRYLVDLARRFRAFFGKSKK